MGQWLQRSAKLFAAAAVRCVLLVGVFICKLLAVLASSGSGAPGGVFTPTLFVGLAMGMLFACFSRLWLPGSEEMAVMMGLTGMAAFLAATTRMRRSCQP